MSKSRAMQGSTFRNCFSYFLFVCFSKFSGICRSTQDWKDDLWSGGTLRYVVAVQEGNILKKPLLNFLYGHNYIFAFFIQKVLKLLLWKIIWCNKRKSRMLMCRENGNTEALLIIEIKLLFNTCVSLDFTLCSSSCCNTVFFVLMKSVCFLQNNCLLEFIKKKNKKDTADISQKHQPVKLVSSVDSRSMKKQRWAGRYVSWWSLGILS